MFLEGVALGSKEILLSQVQEKVEPAALDLKVDSPDHSDVNKLYHLRTPLDDIMCGAAGRGLY